MEGQEGGENMVIRLQDIWQVLPTNHNIQLRIKPESSREIYLAREVSAAWERCPYYRRLARVLSVYALTTETLEITIEETVPEGGAKHGSGL